jgi:hypothetical protein
MDAKIFEEMLFILIVRKIVLKNFSKYVVKLVYNTFEKPGDDTGAMGVKELN